MPAFNGGSHRVGEEKRQNKRATRKGLNMDVRLWRIIVAVLALGAMGSVCWKAMAQPSAGQVQMDEPDCDDDDDDDNG